MTKRRSTKRALLLSALSLLMCVSMLIGSTFAWFTDSVTSAGNKIVSGKLKVDLEVYDKNSTEQNKWHSIKESQEALFTYEYWEPGYVEAKLLKVENEGNLALKWKAAFVSATELGILADVIDVFVKPGVTEAEFEALTRNDLATWTNAGTIREFLGGIEASTYGTLEAEQSATLGIALKMREEAGNEYQEQTLGAFDIKILATQYTFEEDSFDKFYDVFADYDGEISTATALMDALKNGGTYKVMQDITLDDAEVVEVPEGKTVALDLNGNTVTGGYQEGSTTKHVYAITNRGTLTIANGTVTGRGVANYGDLTILDGTFIAQDDNGGGAVWAYSGSTTTIDGGKFIAADDTVSPGATCLNVASGATATINGGEFVGDANQTYAIINSGILTINDATISADHGVISNTNTLTINGGKFTQNGNLNQTSSLLYQTSGNTTINGGEFVFNKDGNLDSGLMLYCAGGKLVVNDGNFGGNIITEVISSWGGAGSAQVYGGTFCKAPNFVAEGCVAVENNNGTFTVMNGIAVNSIDALKTALDNAVDGDIINLASDMTGNITITKKPGVNVTVNGNGRTFTGLITLNGGSDSSYLTIKNFKFVANAGADSVIVAPGSFVKNGITYNNYIYNLIVEDCTFTDTDGNQNCAAVRATNGGHHNWTLKKLTVDSTMHSLYQGGNVETDLVIEGCKINSKNGVNVQTGFSLEMNECTFDVQGYCVRIGAKSSYIEPRTYTIKNSTLKSACAESGDCLVEIRATAVKSTIILENNEMIGSPEILGATADTIIIKK